MFDSIIAKQIKPLGIAWNRPKYIEIESETEEGSKTVEYQILKGADIFLHKQLQLKPSTSKEVFKKDEKIWNDLKNIQLEKAKDPQKSRYPFTLDKETLVYLTYGNTLVDVFDAFNLDSKKEFEEKLDQFVTDVTTTDKTKKFYADGKGNIVKLVCYDKNSDLTKEDYTPVVLIEFNNDKSTYKVYNGILIFKTFTFIPSLLAYQEYNCYSDLIKNVDISSVLDHSKESAKDLYDIYLNFVSSPVEISARELIKILKNVGYKLELTEDDQLNSIEAIADEESNLKIQNFFNTFTNTTGETAYDIFALAELKKAFRFNKLTLIELLSILSKEYLTYDGGKVTASILNDLIYSLYNKNNDKRFVESIEKEIKE